MNFGDCSNNPRIEFYPLRIGLQIQEFIELSCIDIELLEVYLVTKSLWLV